MNRKRLACSNSQCDGICEGDDRFPLVEWRGERSREQVYMRYDNYGVLSFTCFYCKEKYCGVCLSDTEAEFCTVCEKVYCNGCTNVYICEGVNCIKSSCIECDDVKKW